MIVFGGLLGRYKKKLEDVNDLYVLDTGSSLVFQVNNKDTFVWSKPRQKGSIPEERSGHKLIAFGGKLYLIGGGSQEDWFNKYNQLYILDPGIFEGFFFEELLVTFTWQKPVCSGHLDVCTFPSCWTFGPFIFVFGISFRDESNMLRRTIYQRRRSIE